MPDFCSITASARIKFLGHGVPINVPMPSRSHFRCTITPDVFSPQDVPKPPGTFKLRVYLNNARRDQAPLVSTWYDVTGNIKWAGNSEKSSEWEWKNTGLEILNGPIADDLVWVSKAYALGFGKNEDGEALFDVEINFEPTGLFAQHLLFFYTQSDVRPRHREALRQQIDGEEEEEEEEEERPGRNGRALSPDSEEETKPAKKRRVTEA
ncbi:hypothetical protein JCM5353_006865 [Sporobolomyces roseus]